MNAEIKRLFAEYLLDAKDPVAAAVLTLADTLRQSTPEPIIVEADDKGTVGVKEAAELLKTSSKKVYLACLAGRLRCRCVGGRVRIPIDEIERFPTGPNSASTALASRDHQSK
jgi:excisionase family DNA binding protein